MSRGAATKFWLGRGTDSVLSNPLTAKFCFLLGFRPLNFENLNNVKILVSSLKISVKITIFGDVPLRLLRQGTRPPPSPRCQRQFQCSALSIFTPHSLIPHTIFLCWFSSKAIAIFSRCLPTSDFLRSYLNPLRPFSFHWFSLVRLGTFKPVEKPEPKWYFAPAVTRIIKDKATPARREV